MREKRDWKKRTRRRQLTPDKLAEILRITTTEEDAQRTYKHLTGEDIPEKESGK